MIQKVFLDTNVIIDLFLDREPYAEQAEEIFRLKGEFGFDIFISALSITNVAYTLDKLKKRPHPTISKLLDLTKIVDLTLETIKETTFSKFDDFEDGLQYFSAHFIKADIIVTRNKKDFKHSPIPILSPSETIKHFKP